MLGWGVMKLEVFEGGRVWLSVGLDCGVLWLWLGGVGGFGVWGVF